MIKHISLKISAAFIVLTMGMSQTYANDFKLVYQTVLSADGKNNGKSSYDLIRAAYSKKAIESPDLYPSNHTQIQHIIEDSDDIVGPHFVFLSHLKHDNDRGKGQTDRQRNEIKVYHHSNPELMGFEKETLQYRWKFKIDEGFKFSKSFTHFFQLKAKNISKKRDKNGGDSFPLLTLTAVEKSNGRNEFQLRHNSGYDKNKNNSKTNKLIRGDLSQISGKWIEIFTQVTYKEKGNLHFQIKDIESGALIVDYQKEGLDMWRGEGKQDFMRPKWGIYRSLKNKESLRNDEEIARFADFIINKGTLK